VIGMPQKLWAVFPFGKLLAAIAVGAIQPIVNRYSRATSLMHFAKKDFLVPGPPCTIRRIGIGFVPQPSYGTFEVLGNNVKSAPILLFVICLIFLITVEYFELECR